ncbi:Flavonoid 3'-monooxygenase protein [Dioscorea alata]|uniref:Flavonoid 3'-monooxygenase protein n=1 Tax=Dioscorea alata TaxID=55571 RepID=A0ACB7UWJ2_DIOAL|nr:Flavonoid 3'-monooxygenase protein [Dioscorea alata]
MASSLLLIFTTTLISFLFFIIFFYFANKKNNNTNKAHQPPLPPCPIGWPILGNLPQLGSKPHQTLHNLSKTYGPLFRLRFGSVTVVVASSASIASQFLRTLDANFSNRPPNSGAEHIAYNYQDIVFAPYGPRWRMLRRLCSLHLFSAKALDELRHVREGEVKLLASELFRAQGKEVSLGNLVNVCATNALSRAVVGRRVFEEGGVGEFKEMVVELMKLAGVFNIGDFVPWLRPLDMQGVVRRMKRLHRWYDEFLNKIMEEHRMEGGGKGTGDLLSVLLGLKEDVHGDEEAKLTDTNIKALLLNLFTAGTDTSASTVEWAMAELIRHPDILAAVQGEIDAVIGRSRLVSELDLAKLPLLQAIIKETFRLHPSTPLSLPRTAAEPCEVGGFHVPGGATLLVNVWAIARDPEVWSDPLEFKPSRFLLGGSHADVDLKGAHFELIPFGAGRRICAGLSLGLRMVTLMVASLVHGFDWALADGLTLKTLNMDEDFGLTLQRAVPLRARPIPRLSSEAYTV